MHDSPYDADLYALANAQSALLRAGRLDVADVENIAEEIESLGKGEKRELTNRLAALLAHLLNWRYQPIGQCSSWRTRIKLDRNAVVRHLDDSPSLRALPPEAIRRAYRGARREAAGETTLPESEFPQSCPWSFDEIMEPDFWPE